MQSASNLIGRVQEMVKDGSFGSSFFLEKINDGLFEVSAEIVPPSLVVHDSEIEFGANEKSIQVPFQFFGPRLYSVKNAITDKYCTIVYRHNDFVRLSQKFRGSGDIVIVCLKGKTMHVAPIPLAQTTLFVSHMVEPTVFESETDDGSSIDYLPPRLGERAVCAYAAKEVYALIEDGVDGKKINYEKWASEYFLAIKNIGDYFGMERLERAPEQVQDASGISHYQVPDFFGVQ